MGSLERERERERRGVRVSYRKAYSKMKETYEMPGRGYEPLTPHPQGARARAGA